MVTNKTEQTITTPALLDRAILAINATLEEDLSWLTNAYGRSERILSNHERRKAYLPAVYGSSGEYVRLLPDALLGNYTYWEIDSQGYTRNNTNRVFIQATWSLVCYFDFRDVYPSTYENKTKEHVKELLILAMRKHTEPGLKIDVTGSRDDEQDILRAYDTSTIDPGFALRPRGLFKLMGSLEYKTVCGQ